MRDIDKRKVKPRKREIERVKKSIDRVRFIVWEEKLNTERKRDTGEKGIILEKIRKRKREEIPRRRQIMGERVSAKERERLEGRSNHNGIDLWTKW